MGTKDIEKLLTDLKNLPKQSAPEDFEIRLFQRISDYEKRKSSGEAPLRNFIRSYFNPIYAPAFTIIVVAFMIVYSLDRNKLNIQPQTPLEKATPVVQETQAQAMEPQKISVPQKKDFVVKRYRAKLNLGPGVSLDEPEYSYKSNEAKHQFVDFPFPNEPVTIRIPPPEVIFRQEFERLGIPNGNKDSIRLTNTRKR